MPPAYELLLLNTSIPQIQAAQSGDTYLCPRELAVVVNSSTDALRITQTGAGNAILVEDSANPDSTPFVVTAAGDVGIGASSPGYALDVQKSVANGVVANFQSTSTSAVNTGVAFRSSASNAANRNWALLANSSAFGDFVIRTSTTNGGDPVSGTDRLMIDPSGNLGLGVTPSAWSIGRVLQFGNGASIVSYADNAYFNANAYFDSGWKYLGNAAAGRYEIVAGAHAWYRSTSAQVAGTDPVFSQAMTLDASGDLAIGTTTGSIFSTTGVNVSVSNPSGIATIAIAGSTGNSGYLELGQGSVRGALIEGSTNTMIFYTNATGSGTSVTERARITSGGDLLIGSTTDVAQRVRITYDNVTPQWGMKMHSTATSGDNNFIEFGTEASFTPRGSITYNRAGGAIAYNTTSDYRAKDIIGPVQNSGQVIDALKVYTGKMKGATIERPMLVAHEAQEHVPYAVTGEKDAVNEDGTPKYQQMDVSSLVPLLLAEIQSLRARVKALEGA